MIDPRFILTLATGILLLLNGLTAGQRSPSDTQGHDEHEQDVKPAHPDA